jgi:hypothetical protein
MLPLSHTPTSHVCLLKLSGTLHSYLIYPIRFGKPGSKTAAPFCLPLSHALRLKVRGSDLETLCVEISPGQLHVDTEWPKAGN